MNASSKLKAKNSEKSTSRIVLLNEASYEKFTVTAMSSKS